MFIGGFPIKHWFEEDGRCNDLVGGMILSGGIGRFRIDTQPLGRDNEKEVFSCRSLYLTTDQLDRSRSSYSINDKEAF